MTERRRERPDRPRAAAPRAGSARPKRAAAPKPARTPPPRTRSVEAPKAKHAGRPKRAAAPGKASRGRRPGPRPAGAKRPASPSVRRRRGVLAGLLVTLALVGFLFAFVYPTRTYLKQRDQISAAEQKLGVLQHETAMLEQDSKRLRGDTEVERIAREQYGLVRPGETPYVLVPSTTPAAK